MGSIFVGVKETISGKQRRYAHIVTLLFSSFQSFLEKILIVNFKPCLSPVE